MRISSISWVVLVLQAARAMCISSMSWVVLVQNSARGAHQHHLGVVLVRVQPGQCASAASDGLPLSEGSPGSAHHEHQLGFACAEQCGPCASSASVWGCACPHATRALRISSISLVVLVRQAVRMISIAWMGLLVRRQRGQGASAASAGLCLFCWQLGQCAELGCSCLHVTRAMRISGISWLVLVRRQS